MRPTTDQAVTFSYKPLPNASSIRLLRRQSRAAHGHLHFSIETHSLDNPNLEYHCYSYTWGNPFAHGRQFRDYYDAVSPQYGPGKLITIWVDEQPLLIQKNLHDALSTVPERPYVAFLNRPTRNRGRTVTHGAAINGRHSYLDRYVSLGADVNIADEDGRIPLHHAAENGFDDCVELLCKAGSIRATKDNAGKTPLDLAKEANHESTTRILHDWESQPDPAPSSIPRKENGPEDLIWADAICINQTDLDEKNIQVSMMDQIYIRAGFVLAWLGPEDFHTKAGIKALDTLASHLNEFHRSAIEPFGGGDLVNYETAGVPPISREEWDGLASIYQRQWFRRAWIVQEAVLRDTIIVYCGTHTLSCHELGCVAETIRYSEAKSGTSKSMNYTPLDGIGVSVEWNMAEIFKWRENLFFTSRGETEQVRQRYRDMFKLGRLMGDFRTFLALDPRDKVFSLNGLLNIFAEKRYKADYRASVATVYTSAARRIIRETGTLAILRESVFSDPNVDELPSWVPDFAIPGVGAVPEFAADGKLRFQDRGESLEAPTLAVQGVPVGSITRVSGRVSTAPGGKLMFDPSWFKLVLSLRKPKAPESDKQRLTEVLWRTLCMNTQAGAFFDFSRFSRDAPEEMGQQFRIFMLLLILAGADQKMLEAVGLEASYEREQHTIIHEAYDPWADDDLASVLDDLNALEEHDGEGCLTPTKEEVAVFWNELRYTLIRTTSARDDGVGIDFTVPSNVMDGTDRLVGRGIVNADSIVYQKCRGFGAAYNMAYGGRQLFTLDNTFLGLAPVAARADDEIWILPGLNAPAVLRKTVGDSDEEGLATDLEGLSLSQVKQRYQFLGIAYVHGLMNGEAILGRESEVQDISLV
ncbi:hypothetical protein jhhlp_008266 [Lomentospora prolificans]|uniref:Heterokaryon incompatibility domain-containing protein n=1 Tax=Lomentospora prolificans TaxID=41688 RepID=A0A2N3MXJ3_9PEZI|nr:hypothetical protein jhhlp_008266 [Lomentospora prolificans]